MPLRDEPDARRRILGTACDLFYTEGIHAVGVDRVVREAGVAKATLYTHFPSKEALVAAYLDVRSDQWEHEIRARIADRRVHGADGIAEMFALLGETAREPDFRGCPFINAAAEYPHPGLVAARIADHRQRMRALVGDLVDDADAPSRDAVVESIVVIYGGSMVAAYLDASTDPIAVGAAAIADLLARPAAES